MLLNDFFEVPEINFAEGKLVAKIKLNAMHKIYSGHFPGNPITPGVVQVQMVKELLELQFKKSLKMKIMSRCKFLQILNPNQTPFITITIDIVQADDAIKINAAGENNGVTFFKFSATYQ